jgi:hypothetical protein
MMTMKNQIFLLLPLFASACEFGDDYQPYYDSDQAPMVTGLDITSELGTIGGQIVTVNGSNFGDDPNVITVIFGSQNAEILELSADTVMKVRVPRGPVEGGTVKVAVGTIHGQAHLEDAYEYVVDEMYSGEVAFLAVTNDYFSCLGGVGHPYGNFCESWAMSGSAGVDGRGEFLEFDFPRVHAPFTGYRGGFGGTTDESWEQWAVETPAQDLNVFDHEAIYQDLRLEVENFTLVNPEMEGKRWCQDMTADAIYSYAGNEDFGSYDVYGGSWTQEADCDEDWSREYDRGSIEFCQEIDYDVNRSLRYMPDWPVGDYFFKGLDDNGSLSETAPVDVELNVPELGLEGVAIRLPEAAIFYGTQGFWDDQTLTGDEETDQLLAMIAGFDEDCATSGEDDRTTSGDDTGIRWEWEPSNADITVGGAEAARSYVRATVAYVQQGWLGGAGTPIRAVINVEDDANFDEETGRSSLELPASILYQFPSAYQDKGYTTDPIFGDYVFKEWGDPDRPDYGYIITTIERVTEYRIPTGAGGDSNLIFSYSTGDLGYRLFFLGGDGFTSWINPVEAAESECSDCTDNDADGWQDDADPDCGEGAVEDDNSFGIYTCNDGIDNDADGLADADDPGCENGYDGETNCSDDLDNDGDGLIDEEDGECGEIGSGFELGEDDPDWGCINGIDDDLDTWIDFDDPDCESGSDNEIGFSKLACNNDIDDDLHGDIDGEDPYCAFRGASADAEEPDNRSGDCADKADNDGDGYIDANDPDCEFQPYNLEDNGSFNAGDWMVSDECINETDDDGDGFVDAEDTGCTNDAGEADGFQSSETDGSEGPPENQCLNSVDDDADGWVDLDDPDCFGGATEEVGFGTGECNDGADNDDDDLIDAEDPGCDSALDPDEEAESGDDGGGSDTSSGGSDTGGSGDTGTR